MSRRKRPGPPEHDFSQTEEQWDRAVFLRADTFTVRLFYGSAQYAYREFTNFPEALGCVLTWKGEYGRTATLYAAAPTGRWTHLNYKDFPELLTLWMKEHGYWEHLPHEAKNIPL